MRCWISAASLALGLLLLPGEARAGRCVSNAPKNACGACRVESECGGSSKTRLCMRNATKRCKRRANQRGASRKVDRENPRKVKRKSKKRRRKAKRRGAKRAKRRPAFRKVVLAVAPDPIAGFRVDLLPSRPGEEIIYVQNSGLTVMSLEGETLATQPFRGESGGDALRIKGFMYLLDGSPAVVSVWNWCSVREDGAMQCVNYEDTCWESKGALLCEGPPK